MFRCLRSRSWLCALLVAHALIPATAAAGDGFEEGEEVYETITLNDGSTIKGLILVRGEGQDLVVRLPGGKRTTIPRSTVRRIGNGQPEKAAPPAAAVDEAGKVASGEKTDVTKSGGETTSEAPSSFTPAYRTARMFSGYVGLAFNVFVRVGAHEDALPTGAGGTLTFGIRPRIGASYPGEKGGMWHGAVLDLGIAAGAGATDGEGDTVPVMLLHGGFAPGYQFLQFDKAKDGVQKAIGFSLGPRAGGGILIGFDDRFGPYVTPHLGGQVGLSFLTWKAATVGLSGAEIQLFVVRADGYVLGQLGYEGMF